MGSPKYELPQVWESAIYSWLSWLRLGGASRNTVRLRRDHVRAIARRLRVNHPREVTFSALVELCSESRWSREHRKGVRTSLVSFFNWAMQVGLVDANPAVNLPKVRGDKPRPRPATDDVWKSLLATAPPRELMMARLAGEAGLRRNEIALCRRDDLVADRGGWALIVRGKGDRQRVVPVTDSLAEAIRKHCDHGFLFPGETDGHLSANWVGVQLSRLMPAGVSAHCLRHLFASRACGMTINGLAKHYLLTSKSELSDGDMHYLIETAAVTYCPQHVP